jgi:carbon-monoxide dehydrogenase medium subunit
LQLPAHFEYERATDVEHALALLARYGPEARVVAGGHSLLPMMKLRLATPDALIDINDMSELSHLGIEGDDLVIGALVRHAELLASPLVESLFPILHDVERVIADPLVRNRGTIGGSLCQADPSEDLSAAFAAIRASVVIWNATGSRTVSVRDFFLGPYQTAVADGELLTEIRVPISAGPTCHGSAFEKVARRTGDWALASTGAAVWLDGGTVAEVGIGLAAVRAPRFVAAEAEDYLRGRPADEESIAAAGRIAAEHCDPAADQRGPVDYKRHLVGELTTRALRRATERAAERTGM